MAFCTNCGSKIDDEARFCPDCGAPVVPGAPKAEPWEEEKKDFGTKINELNNTPDTTSEFDQNDIQSNISRTRLWRYSLIWEYSCLFRSLPLKTRSMRASTPTRDLFSR